MTIDSLLEKLDGRSAVVCLESTIYPSTTEKELKSRIEARRFKVGKDVFLCFSPEREDPGNMPESSALGPEAEGYSWP